MNDVPKGGVTALPAGASELTVALRSCRSAFAGTAGLSGLINILMLTGSFYMLEVYDRVLPSRSVPTLVGLSILAGVLFVFLGVLDLVRGRLLVRIGASLDRDLGWRVYHIPRLNEVSGEIACLWWLDGFRWRA
jgi:ATP-binding cassette, subfamily C, bacterial PrsD